MRPVAEPAAPSVFDGGLALMAEGSFAGADSTFRRLASRCESGRDGRRALLFLSFLALDPRNPLAHPDSAALMAERFLNLPGATLEETLEAEALYVAALDYGADPELRVDPANPGFAVRFGNCDAPFPSRVARPLPTLEGSLLDRLGDLGEERDSLARRNQQLGYTVGRLRFLSDSLQAQVDTLQAELDRIRQLIRLPDTSVVTLPPDTGRSPPPDAERSRLPDPHPAPAEGIPAAGIQDPHPAPAEGIPAAGIQDALPAAPGGIGMVSMGPAGRSQLGGTGCDPSGTETAEHPSQAHPVLDLYSRPYQPAAPLHPLPWGPPMPSHLSSASGAPGAFGASGASGAPGASGP